MPITVQSLELGEDNALIGIKSRPWMIWGCKTRIGLVCLEKFRPIMNLIKLEFEDIIYKRV